MPNADFVPLPADPRELTLELALQCFDHPEVLVQAVAQAKYDACLARLVAEKRQAEVQDGEGE